MSRVFLAEEPRLGRRVVVKVLPPETSAGIPADRFEREIRVAASLQHPHLVPVLSAGSAGDVVYYVMPYIEGESLAGRLARDGALPFDETVRLLRDVADALAYAHGRGVVHRDIKPDNILLSNRHAVVTDFGVAKALAASADDPQHTTLTSSGLALGTPAYMAPEQAAADPHLDHRADIYALGAVAYEMLSGRPPFTASTAQAMLAAHVAMTPEPVDRYRPGIPADLSAIVMRALAKHPADRWQTAEEMLSHLDGVRTDGSGRTAATVATNAAGPMNRSGARVVAWFALATAVVTGAAFGLSRLAALPDWVWMAALVCMLAGLPILLYTNRIERGRAGARATGEHPLPDRSHRRLFTWRRALLGGAGTLGTLALLTGAYVVSRALGIGPGATLLSAGTLGSEDRLVLADFVNRTADSSLASAVTEALRVDLGQSRVVRLLDSRQIAAALGRMGVRPDTVFGEPLAREVAVREGAKAVVVGDITRLGTGYVLTAHVVTADSGATLAPVRVTADDDARLIPAVNHLSAELRARIGESLKSIRASEPLAQVTTASLPALRLYTAGSRAFLLGDYPNARSLLERAVQTDTAFAMAWRKLAALYFNMGAGTAHQIDASRRAFRHPERLPPLERALTEAYYYTNANYQPEKAIAAYRAALDISPDDPVATNNLGQAYNREGRFAEGESVLWRGLNHNANMSEATNLINSLGSQSKWNLMDSAYRSAERVIPADHPLLTTLRLGGALMQRDYPRADSLVRTKEVRHGGALPPMPYVWARVTLDEMRGHREHSARLLKELMDSSVASGDRHRAAEAALAPAGYAIARGELEAARKLLDAAVGGPIFRGLADADYPAFSLATMYAYLGDPQAVRRARRAFETVRPRESWAPGDSLVWDGMSAQAERRWRDAALAYSQAAHLQHCSPCGVFYAAEMWDAAGAADSAITYYRLGTDRPFTADDPEGSMYEPVAMRRLGDLYEQRGEKQAALEWYGKFVDLWRDADPDLQPQVRDARQRMARLTAEPR
jgi:eukaryotic-like serine/threonine-protein kinase